MAQENSIPQEPALKEMLQDATKDLSLTPDQLERVYLDIQRLGMIDPYTYAIRLRLGYQIAMEQVQDRATPVYVATGTQLTRRLNDLITEQLKHRDYEDILRDVQDTVAKLNGGAS